MASTQNRLVCSSNLFASHPRIEALEAIAALGFSHVDLWGSPTIADHLQALTTDVASIRTDLERTGLEVAAVSPYLTTHEEKVRAMEVAAALGADTVIFEPGPAESWPTIMSNLKVDNRLVGEPGAGLEAFVRSSRPYFELAERLGLEIALEVPHVATVVETTDEIENYLELETSPALGLTLAPPHLALAEEDLGATLKRIGERVSVFCFWNVKPGYVGSRDGRAYGTGEEQLAPDGALDLTSAAKQLLADGGPRDYIITAHGTEKNPDKEAVSSMVRRSLEQVPKELTAGLRGGSR